MSHRRFRRRRSGLAMIHVVVLTGLGFPICVLLLCGGVWVCRALYSLMSGMGGSPYL